MSTPPTIAQVIAAADAAVAVQEQHRAQVQTTAAAGQPSSAGDVSRETPDGKQAGQ